MGALPVMAKQLSLACGMFMTDYFTPYTNLVVSSRRRATFGDPGIDLMGIV
jgi:hypothetical protein